MEALTDLVFGFILFVNFVPRWEVKKSSTSSDYEFFLLKYSWNIYKWDLNY